MKEMRTPLRTVRGLGSAHDGTSHFWITRVSGAALVPLSLFAVGVVFSLLGKGHAEALAALGRPVVALPLILFVAIGAGHMRLGIHESIADYIHDDLLKVAVLMLNTAFCLLVGAAGVFSLLIIAFGA